MLEKLHMDYQNIKTVVDLGAWGGPISHWMQISMPNATIYAVEPVIENFITMQQMILDRFDNHIIPIFAAVSDHTGLQEIYISENSRSHSLLSEMPISNPQGKRNIPVMTWDDMMDALNISQCDFCKVNIEGAEIELLKGMTKVFPKKMAIESHMRKLDDQKYKEELESLITEKGYKIVDRGMITYLVEHND